MVSRNQWLRSVFLRTLDHFPAWHQSETARSASEKRTKAPSDWISVPQFDTHRPFHDESVISHPSRIPRSQTQDADRSTGHFTSSTVSVQLFFLRRSGLPRDSGSKASAGALTLQARGFSCVDSSGSSFQIAGRCEKGRQGRTARVFYGRRH